MVRFLAKLLGLVFGLSLAAGIASALAAVSFKKKAPPRPEAGADEIDLVAVMDGARLASTAASFRGGRVISWYAGVDLDLREATFDPAGARLEIRTVFGGTRVIVVPGVPVIVSGPAIFGGAMNTTDAPEPTPAAPGLEITGFTLFGGLQVIAAERGEAIGEWVPEPAAAAAVEAGPEAAPEPAPEPAVEPA
ncbi:MAG: hypothetical protein V2B17_05450 [Chloroflexota bacterium]